MSEMMEGPLLNRPTQCAIPTFDGLLPDPLGGLVSNLLYINARWHALAKLRVHTDATLILLEQATVELGETFREFIRTADIIKTIELPREAERRARKAAKKSADPSDGASAPAPVQATQPAPAQPGPSVATSTSKSKGGGQSKSQRSKKLNISTIKFHALGHYPSTIRFFGPTDLYSTELVIVNHSHLNKSHLLVLYQGENCHLSPKAWFKSTSKRFIRKEISMHERRRARLKLVKHRLLSKGKSAKAQELREQRTASRNPYIHHYIGKSKSSPIYLSQFSPGGNLSKDVACLVVTRSLDERIVIDQLPVFYSEAQETPSPSASPCVRPDNKR